MTMRIRKLSWVAGVAAASGLVAGAGLAAPTGASAADGQALILGAPNTSTSTTFLNANTYFGLWLGNSGVAGRSALFGDLDREDDEDVREHVLVVRGGDRHAAQFTSVGGQALSAGSYSGTAVSVSATGGSGSPALNVSQLSAGGRGASFSGPAAQIKLEPAGSTHPKSGQKGDLFVDKDGKLWFCKGGTTWKQLA